MYAKEKTPPKYTVVNSCPNTVGINLTLSDLKGPGTSKLDWMHLEHNKIDRNELVFIPINSRFTLIHKKAH